MTLAWEIFQSAMFFCYCMLPSFVKTKADLPRISLSRQESCGALFTLDQKQKFYFFFIFVVFVASIKPFFLLVAAVEPCCMARLCIFLSFFVKRCKGCWRRGELGGECRDARMQDGSTARLPHDSGV